MNYKTAYSYKKPYIYSLIFHSILVLIMLNIHVLVEIEPPKFYELNLGAVSPERLEQIIEGSSKPITAEGRVEVPERKMIEIEEPTISVPAENRIETQDIITNAKKITVEIKAPEFTPRSFNREILPMDRKESYQGSKISVGEKPGAGIETGVIGADEVINFIIEGELEGRKILSNPLPTYPEGLNKNATIKISFEVLPDGFVSPTGMIPVRKENAILENIAMKSLKLWRFSPLSEGSTQKQRGIITFVFKVR